MIKPLLEDPRTRKLSFTGSTEVGRALIAQSARAVLRVSMELGGNAPFIVFEDADLDAAVDGAMLAKMRNIGEACTAANRFYVHESIAAQFAERLAERMGAMKIGRGTEPGVEVGPLIDGAQRDEGQRARRRRCLARRAGARRAARPLDGAAATSSSPRSSPTCRATRELLARGDLRPGRPVVPFSSEDEAVAAANGTEYGLVAYVFTRDLDRALRVCEGLETGMIGLNQGIVSNAAAPFGGVKQSGFGREGGFEGIEEYLETKYVAVAQ